MNWSRGLFRAWIVFSVLWILGMVTLFKPWAHMATVINPPEPRRFAVGDIVRAEIAAPQPPSMQQDAEGKQYQAFDVYALDGGTEQYAALTEREAIAKYARVQEARWTALAHAQLRRARSDLTFFALASLLPVLALLAFGLAVRWVVRGFGHSRA